MSAGCGFSLPVPAVSSFDASPVSLFAASGGGAVTSGGGENADCCAPAAADSTNTTAATRPGR
ncbi:hypothetical protein D3C83_105580 [compost metagenome]